MFETTNHLEGDEVHPARVLQLEQNDITAFSPPNPALYNNPIYPENAAIAISDNHARLLNEPDIIRLMEPGTIYSIAFHKKRDS